MSFVRINSWSTPLGPRAANQSSPGPRGSCMRLLHFCTFHFWIIAFLHFYIRIIVFLLFSHRIIAFFALLHLNYCIFVLLHRNYSIFALFTSEFIAFCTFRIGIITFLHFGHHNYWILQNPQQNYYICALFISEFTNPNYYIGHVPCCTAEYAHKCTLTIEHTNCMVRVYLKVRFSGNVWIPFLYA
jgi:hypothetical protein